MGWENTFKIVVNGMDTVGKSCLLHRYANQYFPDPQLPAVFDDDIRQMTYKDMTIKQVLKETYGNEGYPLIRPLCYLNTTCFVLCFSLVDQTSFDEIETIWIPEIKKNNQTTPIILVGTKSDLRDTKMVNRDNKSIQTENGIRLATEIGAMKYIECSALTNYNIDLVFEEAKKESAIFIGINPQITKCIVC
ncbi:Rho GTPase, putative [Entamoeba invadens IP1]|uniref:small monomeric GTPase n=1 Tax=Entamoeba invadens IP1 TaxID=370355 RepID=L7FJN6_ENTIV|nr:Rho GTPase, putative [Entamoeba invadens IP1]ELP84140.1 Rho GTPase, putative [Entamoeba invadens IP1]|eukprot:XP_004183486.1 Rho GTPase, putative [Entamoeba invadens IP1]